MAGEWIKMRPELWTHPRFLSLCANLASKGDIQGCVTLVTNRNETVTERALRDVTMCALLNIWGAVNAHCKVVGKDAVCEPMTLSDLDRIAACPGYGESLFAVGWVVADGRNVLRFPNFLEFNEPACLRGPAKTPAERQREFRKRKAKVLPDIQERVTDVTKSNGREEKRREEINTPPIPPAEQPMDKFATFWGAYPRKEAKAVAVKAWAKLKPDAALLGVILAAIARQKEGRQWQEGFVPHAATWLNQRRWEDEPEVSNGTHRVGRNPSRVETPAGKYDGIGFKASGDLAADATRPPEALADGEPSGLFGAGEGVGSDSPEF